MSLNSLMTGLMNAVRSVTGVSGNLSIEDATTALNNADPSVDLSVVTATAQTVLTGYNFVDSQKNTVSGSMPNRGAVSQSLKTNAASYTVPAGYHTGNGTVAVSYQSKNILFTPNGSKQSFTGDSNKFISTAYIYPCRMKTYTGHFSIYDSDIDAVADTTTVSFIVPANSIFQNNLPTQYTLSVYTGADPSQSGARDVVWITDLIRDASGTVTTHASAAELTFGELVVSPVANLSATVSDISFVTTPQNGYKFTIVWNKPLSPGVGESTYMLYNLTVWESVPTNNPLP